MGKSQFNSTTKQGMEATDSSLPDCLDGMNFELDKNFLCDISPVYREGLSEDRKLIRETGQRRFLLVPEATGFQGK
jgi:hypothetical protein